MKKILTATLIMLIFSAFNVKAQPADSIDIYLLTCEPGNAIYSVYGHTAIRVSVRGTKTDVVYNWGVFDFEAPHFAYRFAKGKLDYLLDECSYKRFLEEYFYEDRSVWSQKINLTSEEKIRLIELINENLKPENIKYRYNFFYDNCATRVRDIIENSLTKPVIYYDAETQKSFRKLINEFQSKMPWVDFGADFLLGLPADKKATFRDEMFLPFYLMDNMSGANVLHNGIKEPLLGQARIVLDMRSDELKSPRPWMPAAIVWLVFVFVTLVTFVFGIPVLGRISDWLFLTLFSLLSVILFFTTFFSDHQALHYNIMAIAFNLLIPAVTINVFMGKKRRKLCRITCLISFLSIPVALIAGQAIHPVAIPMILILLVRLFKHCEFGKEDTEMKNKKSVAKSTVS